jgi:carbon-monoxide dehydrogenase large subunit/6-hydroxypseudooxynicotine dehydrogenase subunit gamma
MTGEATRRAGLALRAKALERAAEQLQTPADELDISDGIVLRADGRPGPSMPLAEIVRSGPLHADAWFHTDHMNYPYGLHIAVVRIDRDTGAVLVERYLVAYDVGKAVNPMLVEGQIAGGFAQGLGGALLEEFVYDERGEPLSVTFADYLIPSARETPPVEVLITEDAPSPLNSLGLKGAGEGGANAVGAAIASAIDDALGRPGAVTTLPVTPMRMRELLRSTE